MSFAKKIDGLKADIAEKRSEAEAYIKLADEEKRDLTAEESTAVDAIVDTDIPALQAQLARCEKLEMYRTPPQQGETGGPSMAAGPIDPQAKKLPATVKRHGSLKAFKGENADVEAYQTGQFLLAINGNEHAKQWCKDHGIHAALSTTDNSLGGALVPNVLSNRIIDLREMFGVFRQQATVMGMPNDTLTIPRRIGSHAASWVGENSEIPEGNLTLDNVELVARKLAVLTRMSTEVNDDTIINLADMVTLDIARVMAEKEDEAGFNGDGTSGFGGVVGCKNALLAGSTFTPGAGGTITSFGALTFGHFESMIGKLPMFPGIQPKWYISMPAYAASMMRLLDAAGGNTIETLENGSISRSFLGYPVVISQVLNKTLTAQASAVGVLYFGDLSYAATMGSVAGMRIRVSEDRYFEFDQIGLRVTERVAINVHERGTATEAGPLIRLNFPAN